MSNKYVISQDRNGMWYAHAKGYPNIPVFGSLSHERSVALEYAKMYNNLPNKVAKIEAEKKARKMEEDVEK